MIRRLLATWWFRGTLLLVAGTVMNVSVAWGIAAWMPRARNGIGLRKAGPVAWPVAVPDDWPEPAVVYNSSTWGWREYWLYENVSRAEPLGRNDRPEPGGPVTYRYGYIAGVGFFGWPMKALSHEFVGYYVSGSVRSTNAGSARFGLLIEPLTPVTIGSGRRLPVVPLPLGLALNTVVYAVVIAALMAGASAVRRVLHPLSPGQCRRCRYELGRLVVCPECGTPVFNPSAPLTVAGAIPATPPNGSTHADTPAPPSAPL